MSRDQRPEADVSIEFQSGYEMAEESMKLAFLFKAAADAYPPTTRRRWADESEGWGAPKVGGG